ncbi:MAG: hypothetical protein K1X53_08150 [Candidatus Sumerlaeaceae bacterium]|nr:hypothetical protein [Candidatus Sumerlaeaceae bacterium]
MDNVKQGGTGRRVIAVMIIGVVLAGLAAYAVLFERREIYLARGGAQCVVLQCGLFGRVSNVMVRYPRGSSGLPYEFAATALRTGCNMTIISTYQFGGPYKTVHQDKLIAAANDHNWLLVRSSEEHIGYKSDGTVESITSGTTQTPSDPIPFWTRIDDPKVLKYFEITANLDGFPREGSSTATTESLVTTAADLVARHPDNAYVRTLFLDALLRNRRMDELAAKLREWQQDENTRDPWLALSRGVGRSAVRRHELKQANRDAGALWKKAEKAPFAEQLRLMADFMNYEEMPVPVLSLSVGNETADNFLGYQVAVKAVRIGATLLLFQGRRDEALGALAGSYRLGQLLNGQVYLVSQLIGCALRSMATAGLELYLLNACESANDIAAAWPTLEALEKLDQKRRTQPGGPQDIFLTLLGSRNDHNWRIATADARFEVARMAAAAKHEFLSAGSWPRTPADFGPLLPGGPPTDPHTSQPLSFFSANGDFVCYSWGPDETDNRAQLSYDPTNGTLSAGDLITTVPRERTFPFPATPVVAGSADDLRRQFPRGLPTDIYADRKTQTLSITADAPICIFSAGPDCDSWNIDRAGPSYRPTIQYDPTNGAVSVGDIFIVLPTK